MPPQRSQFPEDLPELDAVPGGELNLFPLLLDAIEEPFDIAPAGELHRFSLGLRNRTLTVRLVDPPRE